MSNSALPRPAASPIPTSCFFAVALLAGSPSSDHFVPGLIPGGVFGIGSVVVAAAGLRRWRLAPFLTFAVGCARMIWIVVGLAIIHEVSLLHSLFFSVGLAIAITSVRWGWPTFPAWRAARWGCALTPDGGAPRMAHRDG